MDGRADNLLLGTELPAVALSLCPAHGGAVAGPTDCRLFALVSLAVPVRPPPGVLVFGDRPGSIYSRARTEAAAARSAPRCRAGPQPVWHGVCLVCRVGRRGAPADVGIGQAVKSGWQFARLCEFRQLVLGRLRSEEHTSELQSLRHL